MYLYCLVIFWIVHLLHCMCTYACLESFIYLFFRQSYTGFMLFWSLCVKIFYIFVILLQCTCQVNVYLSCSLSYEHIYYIFLCIGMTCVLLLWIHLDSLLLVHLIYSSYVKSIYHVVKRKYFILFFNKYRFSDHLLCEKKTSFEFSFLLHINKTISIKQS